MTFQASLPMYDFPAIRQAHNTWWQCIVRNLNTAEISAPNALSHDLPDLMSHWVSEETLISQTCGWPATILGDRIELVAAPVYAVDGCRAAEYSSWIIARAQDGPADLATAHGRTVCYNADDSLSGYHLLRRAIAPFSKDGNFFAAARQSGSHRDSLVMVRSRQADIAAVDCVSWALLKTHAPETVEGLEIIGQTPFAKSLPYITSTANRTLAPALFECLQMAVTDPASTLTRAALFLEGFAPVTKVDYADLPGLSAQAEGCASLPFVYPDRVL